MWNDTEIKQHAAAREMMCFILSGFRVLLDELAWIGISIISHRKHTMISCLPVGLLTSSSLGVWNSWKDMQGGLGKGAIRLYTSRSSRRQNFQHGRNGAEESLSIFHYKLMPITHAGEVKRAERFEMFLTGADTVECISVKVWYLMRLYHWQAGKENG